MRKPPAAILTAALAVLALAAPLAAAHAETPWQRTHPLRTIDNARLANQDRRIHQEVRDGQITRARAVGLHREDRQIRQEERDMASQNGTHLTGADQTALRQQENGVSRQIGR